MLYSQAYIASVQTESPPPLEHAPSGFENVTTRPGAAFFVALKEGLGLWQTNPSGTASQKC